jgi:hypothetical protein
MLKNKEKKGCSSEATEKKSVHCDIKKEDKKS